MTGESSLQFVKKINPEIANVNFILMFISGA